MDDNFGFRTLDSVPRAMPANRYEHAFAARRSPGEFLVGIFTFLGGVFAIAVVAFVLL